MLLLQRRRDWASFWTGQGVNDINIAQKIWNDSDEKSDEDNGPNHEMTVQIMKTLDLKSVCTHCIQLRVTVDPL